MSNLKHVGKLLSGTDISRSIKENLCQQLKKVKRQVEPCLAIVQVGDRPDSTVYIKAKIKAAENVGVKALHVKLPRSTDSTLLESHVNKLNLDSSVHGIIVQMPLETDHYIDATRITNLVDHEKDVDGLNVINQGKLCIGDLETGFIPCTPAGCIDLIRTTGTEISGANAVVMGRSKIVGTPMAELLKWHNATVTVCHSKTRNLPEILKKSDILVAAIGNPEFVKGDWIKPGAVVIDCGINVVPDVSKKSGTRLVGDVQFDAALKVASYVTPVPGGVGPMTVALLISNVVKAAAKKI